MLSGLRRVTDRRPRGTRTSKVITPQRLAYRARGEVVGDGSDVVRQTRASPRRRPVDRPDRRHGSLAFVHACTGSRMQRSGSANPLVRGDDSRLRAGLPRSSPQAQSFASLGRPTRRSPWSPRNAGEWPVPATYSWQSQSRSRRSSTALAVHADCGRAGVATASCGEWHSVWGCWAGDEAVAVMAASSDDQHELAAYPTFLTHAMRFGDVAQWERLCGRKRELPGLNQVADLG